MRNREDEIRATVSVEEAIRRIEKLGGVYDPSNASFDVYDQLLACEAVTEATPVRSYPNNETENNKENVVAYENGIGSYKRSVNFELTASKLEAISKLKKLNYITSPPEIAGLLEVIFEGCNTKPGWWLSVGQQWNPKTINSVIAQLIKLLSGGWKTIKNPAAYFTFVIIHRPKRRSLPVPMVAVNKRLMKTEQSSRPVDEKGGEAV